MNHPAACPAYSVVIPTLEEAGHITDLLSRLSQQSILPKEIIVVDGGSHDKTVELALKWQLVKVLRSSPPVAHQRNAGAHSATSQVIFFMDADVYPKPDFCERTLTEFTQRRLSCACPWTEPHHSTVLISAIFWFFNAMFWLCQWIQASGGGMCIVTTKKLFDQSRGFKTTLKFEDIEFIRRASRLGRFRLLTTTLAVSDRRFRRDGVLTTFLKYLVLGMFFSLGFFRLSNIMTYQFGHYAKKRGTS